MERLQTSNLQAHDRSEGVLLVRLLTDSEPMATMAGELGERRDWGLRTAPEGDHN
jgi:hypothetical protein